MTYHSVGRVPFHSTFTGGAETRELMLELMRETLSKYRYSLRARHLEQLREIVFEWKLGRTPTLPTEYSVRLKCEICQRDRGELGDYIWLFMDAFDEPFIRVKRVYCLICHKSQQQEAFSGPAR